MKSFSSIFHGKHSLRNFSSNKIKDLVQVLVSIELFIDKGESRISIFEIWGRGKSNFGKNSKAFFIHILSKMEDVFLSKQNYHQKRLSSPNA